jgi:hypothetical protein
MDERSHYGPAPGFGTKGCGDGSREGAESTVARLLARTFAGEEVRAVEERGRRDRRLTTGRPLPEVLALKDEGLSRRGGSPSAWARPGGRWSTS